ncbi:hypothetical protein L7F22_053074 [Adiantum nelumboides]|nr:hypothetical protein [Adiantum nelumboides]
MKIFLKWRQRKPDNIKKGGISDDELFPWLDATDQQRHLGVSLPKPSFLADSFDERHDINPLNKAMAMPENLSDQFLTYTRKPNSSSNHDHNHDQYMSQLLMCHCTLQNAFLSIGTLGEELLSKLEADFVSEQPSSNSNFYHGIDEDSIDVMNCQNDHAYWSLEEGQNKLDEKMGSYRQKRSVPFEERKLKHRSIDHGDQCQRANMHGGHNAGTITDKCHIARYKGADDCSESVQNEMESTQKIVIREKVDSTFMNHELLSMSHGRFGFSDTSPQNYNMDSAKFANMVDSSPVDVETLHCSHEAKICSCTLIQGTSTSSFIDSHNGIQMGSASYRSATQELHSMSAYNYIHSSLGSLSSSSLSTCSTESSAVGSYGSTIQGLQLMDKCSSSSSISSFSTCSSTHTSVDIKERRRANESAPKGCFHLKLKANVANASDDDKREDAIDYEMATLSCLKDISANYHVNLKRLILFVTPTYLAKHLLTRLRLVKWRRQAVYPPDYSYQRKFSEFLRTFRTKYIKVCRTSGALKRELGCDHLINALNDSTNDIDDKIEEDSRCMNQIIEELQAIKEEVDEEELEVDEEEELDPADPSTAADSSFRQAQDIPCGENWINTDAEFVVLELEGNKEADEER